MTVLEQVKSIGLVPVVVINKLEDTIPTLQTLVEGDVNVAEICFRTECAKAAIELAVKEFPNMLIGAGTVINATQCEDAIKAGVKFIVSPGLSASVAEVCKKNNVPYLPGIVTPTELMAAIDLGITTVKFFPAGEFGGLKTIKALGAAFPFVKFMPTGGVNNDNLKEFIANEKIVAVGGSWLLKGSHDDAVKTCLAAREIVKQNR